MRKFIPVLFLTILVSFSRTGYSQAQFSVNLTTTITDFTHLYDCCNDGPGIVCPFTLSGSIFDWNWSWFINWLANYPEPRFKAWAGYGVLGNLYGSAGSTQFTGGSGLRSGCAAQGVYGCDGGDNFSHNDNCICPIVDASTTVTQSDVAAEMLQMDLQIWEEDARIWSSCVKNWNNDPDQHCGPGSRNPDDCTTNPATWPCCIYNAITDDHDDINFGRRRLENIVFWERQPCVDYTYFQGQLYPGFLRYAGGDTRDDYHGILFLTVNWSFSRPPVIVKQPTEYAGAFVNQCTDIPLQLQFEVNRWHPESYGWTLGRWVRWEMSTDGTNWSAISGSQEGPRTTKYIFQSPSLNSTVSGPYPKTVWYRAKASSHCTNIGLQFTNTDPVQVTWYDPTSAFCTSPQCSIAYVDPTLLADPASGGGGPANPYKTLTAALASGATYLRVAVGGGTETSVVSIPSNVVIEGGYVRSGSSGERWEKAPTTAAGNSTQITFTGTIASGGPICGATVLGLRANGTTGWKIMDMTIQTGNSPGGYGNLGLWVNGGSGTYTNVNFSNGTSNCGAATKVYNGTAQNPANGLAYPASKLAIDFYSKRKNVTGRACINSEIDLTTLLGGSWSLPSGISLVNDRYTSSSNHSLTNNAIAVTASTANTTYTINSNGTPIRLHVTEDARTAPTVSPTLSEICFGGSATLTASNSWDVTSIMDREWYLYDNVNNYPTYVPNAGTAPIDTVTGSATATFSGFTEPAAGVPYKSYYVRYRERHQCCGWSKPAFAEIRVYHNPTKPTINPTPALTSVCIGKTVKADFQLGLESACTYTYEYSIDNAAWQTYGGSYNATTKVFTGNNPIPGSGSATSSVRVRVRQSCPGTGNVVAECGGALDTIYEWSVVQHPSVVINKLPTTDTICEGDSVRATIENIGGVNCQDQHEIRYKTGTTWGNWGTYINGDTIPTTGFTGIEIRSRRVNCEANASCTNSAYTTVGWVISEKPTAEIGYSDISVCSGSAELAAANITPGATIIWNKIAGLGSPTPTTSNANPVTIANIYRPPSGDATTSYTLSVGTKYCPAEVMDTIDIVMPALGETDPTMEGYICVTCDVKDGATGYFYDPNGMILAKIQDISDGVALGYTEVCFGSEMMSGENWDPYGTGEPQIVDDNLANQPYLIRRYAIQPTNNTASIITFYVSKPWDYEDLQYRIKYHPLDPVTPAKYTLTTPADLAVTKYPGGGSPGDNGGAGPNRSYFTDPSTFERPNPSVNPNGEYITITNIDSSYTSYVWVDPNTGDPAPVYALRLSPISTYSTFYIHSKSREWTAGPLPVELVSLTATPLTSSIMVDWQTASEINNDRFEVERSTNGITFEKVGVVPGLGNSNQPQSYSFEDKEVNKGVLYYYRLKVVDLDGSSEYSDIVTASLDVLAQLTIGEFVPNPTQNTSKINIIAEEATSLPFVLFNLDGSEAMKQTYEIRKGFNQLEFDFSRMSSGTYVGQFRTPDGNVIRKLVKIN